MSAVTWLSHSTEHVPYRSGVNAINPPHPAHTIGRCLIHVNQRHVIIYPVWGREAYHAPV